MSSGADSWLNASSFITWRIPKFIYFIKCASAFNIVPPEILLTNFLSLQTVYFSVWRCKCNGSYIWDNRLSDLFTKPWCQTLLKAFLTSQKTAAQYFSFSESNLNSQTTLRVRIITEWLFLMRWDLIVFGRSPYFNAFGFLFANVWL